jgi:hypothetical protein
MPLNFNYAAGTGPNDVNVTLTSGSVFDSFMATAYNPFPEVVCYLNPLTPFAPSLSVGDATQITTSPIGNNIFRIPEFATAMLGFQRVQGRLPLPGPGAVFATAPPWSMPTAPPFTATNFIPIRYVGSLDVQLTPQPQADPNSPHNVHPMITISGAFDTNRPYVTTVNQCDSPVILYTRLFETTDTSGSYQDGTPIQIPAGGVGGWCVQQKPKTWYGYAFQGQYENSGAYFTAHPYDPQGGHHTGEIDQ